MDGSFCVCVCVHVVDIVTFINLRRCQEHDKCNFEYKIIKKGFSNNVKSKVPVKRKNSRFVHFFD